MASKIRQLYYSLFLSYKTIDILKENADLYARIEDAAASRYASGMGTQEEVVMAQTEKYMLLEKEEMERQKIEALQGMLNTTVGRELRAPSADRCCRPPPPFNMTLSRCPGRLPGTFAGDTVEDRRWWKGRGEDKDGAKRVLS